MPPLKTFINAGEMRHRITIQANNPTPDPANQMIDNWSNWLCRWAKIESSEGSQLVQAEQLRNDCTHVITLRYLATLSPRIHQIVFQSRVFNLLSVVNFEERNILSVCQCKEVLQ